MEDKDREQLKKLVKNVRDSLQLEKQTLLTLKSSLCIFYNLLDVGKTIDPTLVKFDEKTKDLFDKATNRLKEIEEYEEQMGWSNEAR